MAKTTGPKSTVSAKVMAQIKDLKRPFQAFTEAYGKLSVSRAELAPKFMRAFGGWLKETGGSFVEFVRIIDPTVPADREAYTKHASYNAATYLRRLQSRRDVTGNRAKPVRSNLNGLSRALATILPFVPTGEVEAFWKGIGAEMGLTARQVGKLRQVVASVQPLIKLPTSIKPIHNLKIVHQPVIVESANRTAAA